MDDNHFFAVDAVEVTIGRGSDPECIQIAPIGSPAAIRVVLKSPYSSDDSTDNSSRGLRTALIKV